MTGIAVNNEHKHTFNSHSQSQSHQAQAQEQKINIVSNNSKMLQSKSFSISCTILIVFVCLLFVAGSSVFSFQYKNHDDWNHDEDFYEYNERPIIGILSQEYYAGTKPPTPANLSYIAASYVKFVEGAGARVVPILINQDQSYYEKIFNSVNGILFPGGGVDFDSSEFGKAGKVLYSLAKSANDNGDFFPLWGTCMGFEFLVYTAVGNHDILANCNAQNITNKLQFTKDAMTSKLFGTAPKSIIKLLETKNLTANFHHRCLTNEIVKSYNLKEQLQILSWNFDATLQLKYVSSFEFTKYPFYGVQFHPEKNIYEWSRKEGLPHSFDAIQVAQYFANFFVRTARRNNHTFKSETEENDYLIYKYNPVFTGANGSMFEQIYLFPL